MEKIASGSVFSSLGKAEFLSLTWRVIQVSDAGGSQRGSRSQSPSRWDMERDPSPEEHGRLILETLVCKLGRKVTGFRARYKYRLTLIFHQKWAGLAIQAPRSHVLPIDGMAMDLVVCLDRSKSMGRYWSLVVVRAYAKRSAYRSNCEQS